MRCLARLPHNDVSWLCRDRGLLREVWEEAPGKLTPVCSHQSQDDDEEDNHGHHDWKTVNVTLNSIPDWSNLTDAQEDPQDVGLVHDEDEEDEDGVAHRAAHGDGRGVQLGGPGQRHHRVYPARPAVELVEGVAHGDADGDQPADEGRVVHLGRVPVLRPASSSVLHSHWSSDPQILSFDWLTQLKKHQTMI